MNVVDFTSPEVPIIIFRNGDESLEVSVDIFVELSEKLNWNLVDMIRVLRINRTPHLSLKLCKDTAEWIKFKYQRKG